MNTQVAKVQEQSNEAPQIELGLPFFTNLAILGTFAILFCACLYIARDLFIPLALAILIYLTLIPLVRFLSLRGVPEVVSAIVLVVLVTLGVGFALMMLREPFMQMINDAPRIVDDVQKKLRIVREPVEALIEAGKQVEELARVDSGPTVAVAAPQPGLWSWAAGTVARVVTTSSVTIVLIVFLLSSGDLFLQKFVRMMPTLTDKKKALRVVRAIEGEVSRYLLTVTVINCGLGVAIAAAMAILQLPNPVLWGVAAAVLNFIPYLGAATGIVSVAAVAIVTFPTFLAAAIPPLAYLALNTIENIIVTPLVLGRRLELNAVVILISLAFWGWMWGIIGTFVAVPMLVITKVFCDNFPGLANFGDFLSGETPQADRDPHDSAKN